MQKKTSAKINGSDYFTENFRVKENKTKMKNIHLRFFPFAFLGVKIRV